MTFDKLKLQAQRDANRTGKRLAVLNLNKFSPPLYVIRQWDDRFEGDKGLVWIAYPGTIDQGG